MARVGASVLAKVALAAAMYGVPAAAIAVPALEAGWGHNLAISGGGVWAWGDNSLAALGNGTQVSSSLPVRAGTLTGVIAVAAGRNFSLALRSDGTVWSWGTGPLGYAPPDSCGLAVTCSRVPRQVSGLSGVTAIAAGHKHALALKSDGTVMAWGDNQFGKLGTGNEIDQETPVAVPGLTGVAMIAAAESHSVALKTNGTVSTWGANAYGELGVTIAQPTICIGNPRYGGLGTQQCSLAPVTIPAFTGVAAISAKGRHTLALKADGTLFAWGSNHYGQIGKGDDSDARSPAAVPGMTGVSRMAAGFAHSIAIRTDGTYWAWGLNLYRRLGVPDTMEACAIWSCRRSPARGATHDAAAIVVGGGAHSLEARATGALVAFGFNESGQLGTGVASDFTRFADVDPDGDGGQGAAATGASIGKASTAGAIDLDNVSDGIAFGPQAIDTTSAALELRLSNYGTGAFAIFSIATTGEFEYGTDCGATLASGAECRILVSFRPVDVGPRAGTLDVRLDDAGSTPLSLDLTGTGTAILHTLTVLKEGSGTVISTPAGIDCGATCSAPFIQGRTIGLTATATAGFAFTGWRGACLGSGACNVTMNAEALVRATFTSLPPAANPARLVNISTRMQVLTADNVLIGGFIIGGTQPKTVVVRARGPSLAAFGITNFLANPKLDLYSGQSVIASNDDWQQAGNAQAIQLTGFAPANAQEAAILVTLDPGPYTGIVSGVGNTTGVGIIEIFEADRPDVPLANISTRGAVLTGNDVMIGGFVIQGDSPQTVIVRARGPSLAPFGISNFLANPVLQLYSGQAVIASNDNWQQAANAAVIQSLGFAPAEPFESAMLITLNPGAYTAIVTGAGGTTGVGIIEVFAQ